MERLRAILACSLAVCGAAWGAGNEDAQRAYAAVERAKPITISLFDGTIPHFVDGDGWQSTIILTNLVESTVYYQIFFNSDTATPQPFDFVGVGRAAAIAGQLGVGQTVEIPTTGTSATLTQGYARMFNYDRPPNQAGAQVTESRAGGYSIFRRRVAGQPDQEAVVPLSDPFEKSFTIPFDNRNGFFSGVAIVNDTTQTGTLRVTARDNTGTVLVTETTPMPAGLKQVYLVRDKYPATAGRSGVLQFSIDTIGLSGLGLRFNPTGSYTSTHPLRY